MKSITITVPANIRNNANGYASVWMRLNDMTLKANLRGDEKVGSTVYFVEPNEKHPAKAPGVVTHVEAPVTGDTLITVEVTKGELVA